MELVACCRAGDQRAWAQLVDEFSPLVYSIPLRSGLSREEAEDIVQTVFALLVRKLDSIEDPQALPKWISVTTQRACWREIRSGRARRDRESSVAPADPSHSIENAADAEHQAEIIRIALSEIGDRCERLLRVLFGGSGGKGPAYERVSEATSMPIGSIGPTRARCLKRLTQQLQDRSAGRALLCRFARDFEESEGN
jgi:RNA polymerase sigma factor (sigma-70 family)